MNWIKWIALLFGQLLVFLKVLPAKAESAEETPSKENSFRPSSFVGAAALETDESIRKQDFCVEKKVSTETFEYHKGIFGTWMNDIKINYGYFCGLGLKPMTKDDLIFAQDTLTTMLNEIRAELSKR